MAEVEVASVLPKELRLGVPPKMPQARTYMFRQQSTLSSPYTPGQTIQINIPRLQRSYLRKDSYLRFRVNGVFDATNQLDVRCKYAELAFDTPGAFGIFEKLEVFDYLGSTVLESISGVPQMMALLLDMGLKEVIDESNGSELAGLGYNYATSMSSPYPSTNENAQFGITSSGTVYPPSSGAMLTKTDMTNTIAAGSKTNFSREFAIPMPSFLGFLSDKMVPLHNGFTIVLTLATKNTPFFSSVSADIVIPFTSAGALPTTAPKPAQVPFTSKQSPNFSGPTVNWNVSDVYMQCQILELGPEAESMILSSTQGQPLVVHTKAMRNYAFVVPEKAQEFNLTMNLNVASLTNLLWFMRPSNHLDNILYASIGARTRNFLWRWYFQYGSTTLPQSNGIQAMPTSVPDMTKLGQSSVTDLEEIYQLTYHQATEAYQEFCKARPLSLTSHCINWDNYNVDAIFNSNITNSEIQSLNWSGIFPAEKHPYNMPRFAAGLNLELANNKTGGIISGLNTNGMNTSIRLNFHPLFSNWVQTCRIDAFAEYDAFINISPGIATTVSF